MTTRKKSKYKGDLQGYDTKIYDHKKVLLRERKRHTDRRLSSTPSVNQVGYPLPLPRSDGVGGTQGGILPWLGYPPSRSDRGVPEVGYPLVRVPHVGLPTCQGTPCLGTPHRGTPIRVHPPSWTWLGYPPHPRLDLARVPLPLGVDWQTKWNYYLPSRTTYAVGNKKQVTSQYSDRQREVLLHV